MDTKLLLCMKKGLTNLKLFSVFLIMHSLFSISISMTGIRSIVEITPIEWVCIKTSIFLVLKCRNNFNLHLWRNVLSFENQQQQPYMYSIKILVWMEVVIKKSAKRIAILSFFFFSSIIKSRSQLGLHGPEKEICS